VTLSDSGSNVCAVDPLDTGGDGMCAAMSLRNAEDFYYLSRVGDVVIVTGSAVAPSTTDHGTADWNIPWSALTPVAS
jgi:hypothetical protein